LEKLANIVLRTHCGEWGVMIHSTRTSAKITSSGKHLLFTNIWSTSLRCQFNIHSRSLHLKDIF